MNKRIKQRSQLGNNYKKKLIMPYNCMTYYHFKKKYHKKKGKKYNFIMSIYYKVR